MRREEQPTPRKSALPSWLSGQTIALLSGMIALGAFCQNGFSSLRQDFNGLRVEVKGEIHALREELKGDIAALRTELKGDIATLRAELKGDMEGLRAELKGDVAELRTDLRRLEDRTRAVEVAVVGNSVRLDNLERTVADVRSQVEGPAPSVERLAGERSRHVDEHRADASPTQGIAGNE